MKKKIFGSTLGKAKSSGFRRKCVEYLAHYSLSKTHDACTVVYDKDTATIKVCENGNEVSTKTEDGRTEIHFSGTGLNEWYRALNRAGYRTFMGGHELVLIGTKGDEQVWYYLTPPLQHASSSNTLSGSDTLQQTATGTITFLGDNTICDFNIVVNYKSSTE